MNIKELRMFLADCRKSLVDDPVFMYYGESAKKLVVGIFDATANYLLKKAKKYKGKKK